MHELRNAHFTEEETKTLRSHLPKVRIQAQATELHAYLLRYAALIDLLIFSQSQMPSFIIKTSLRVSMLNEFPAKRKVFNIKCIA